MGYVVIIMEIISNLHFIFFLVINFMMILYWLLLLKILLLFIPLFYWSYPCIVVDYMTPLAKKRIKPSMIWKVLLFTITYRAVLFEKILNILQQRNNISVWNTNKTETFLDAIYQWGGTCTLQTWDIQEEVCTWCPDHNCDISQPLTSGDLLYGGSIQSTGRLYKWWHHCKHDTLLIVTLMVSI